MAWNMSAAKRRALVALQLRDKHGRFIDMGKSVKWYSVKHKMQVSGTVEDGKDTRAIVRMSDGPDKGKLVYVQASQIEVIDSKATLAPKDGPSADQTPEVNAPDAVAKVDTPESKKDSWDGAYLSDVSLADMAKMPEGTILANTSSSGGHFVKGSGDVWQQYLSTGSKGSLGSSASIKNHDGFAKWAFAPKGTDPNSVKATVNKSEGPGIPNPKDDPAYEETMAKYAPPAGEFKPYLVTATPDGNTYISAPEGQELYTPAKELAIGDEVIAPDGAHPQKPFSMGKSWPNKKAERVNTAGPKIGKVISIKEHAYAVVQLPEGETVESTQKPGEQVNSVTIGLSNKVIKATPELKASLKDVIPEPKYADAEAPAADAEDKAKRAKRLSILKSVQAGSTVTSKSGAAMQFTKHESGMWTDPSGKVYLDDSVVDFMEKNPVGWLMDSPTAADSPIGEVSNQSVTDQDLLDKMYDGFAAELAKAPKLQYSLAGKDEAYGAFDGFNDVEVEAISEYVGSSVFTNSSLRQGKINNNQVASIVLGMDSILDRSVLQEDTKVFRGVGATTEMLDNILAKGVMSDRAFTSTSVDSDFADSWIANTGSAYATPVIMEINLPKGFKAHKVDYMVVGNGFDHENEVVLPRDIDFDITDVQEYTNASGQKGYRVQATPILNEKNYNTGAINGPAGTADSSNGADNGSDGNPEADSTSPDTDNAGSEALPGEPEDGSVYDNAGSGLVPQPGRSGETAPAESGSEDSNGPVTKEDFKNLVEDLKAQLEGSSDEAPKSAGLRRNRETIMSELEPIDTSAWKKVGGQAGSNPGGVFEDENGQKWYVKQSKSDTHARAEVLADQLYKASGIDASGLKLTQFNGKLGTASPMIDGAKSDLGSKLHSDKAYMDKVREGFAVDAWLANWDVLGLGNDNIVTDSSGNPVRIDTGGTMMFRAQGGLKNDQQPGAWGNEVKDWDGLRQQGEAQQAFKNITDQQLVDSAARVEAVTPEEIDSMVDALGWQGTEAADLKSTLKARRDDIIAKAAALGVAPSQKQDDSSSSAQDSAAPAVSTPDTKNGDSSEPTDAPSAPSADPSTEAPEAQTPADESFEPVRPSSKPKPKFPKATKENPNTLTGYTIEKNERGVYYPTERLSMSAWQGLRNGTIVPPNLPFIPFNTKSGEVHYWDSTGVRHWGQYGGEGALTRRKNANGEFEYLLAQRASGLSTSPNMWSTPGGAHALESDSMGNGITAKIELEEELGLKVHGEPVAGYKHETAPDWGYNYAIFDAPEGTDVSLDNVDRHEIQDLKWMTADQIRELRDNGKLQANMAEVLDDVLNASEAVEKDEPQATTPETNSDTPEVPSQAAEDAPEASPKPLTDEEISAKADEAVKAGEGADPADIQAAKDAFIKMLKDNQEFDKQDSADNTSEEAPAPAEALPPVDTNGPSATMSDGKPAYVGSRVAHEQFGYGTVIQIIAGKSAKIEFDDGLTKISQAHKISSHDKVAAPDAKVDTTNMAAGDVGNNPSNGKQYILGSDKAPIYPGDKVEAMHKGEVRSGVVKGIYPSTNSVAIVFDGDDKPSTKKAAISKSLEAQPEVSAPESTPDTGEASEPTHNENGYTTEEQAKVDSLEAQLAEIYKGNAEGDVDALEGELDNLYKLGDARLAGEPDPDPNADAVIEDAPEAVNAPETAPEPEAAPEADKAPEEAPARAEKAPEEAPSTEATPEPAAESEIPQDPEANDDNQALLDEVAKMFEASRTPANATSSPAGTSVSLGDGSNSTFVKTADGDWELNAGDFNTGIKGTDAQIQDIADHHGSAFVVPQADPEEEAKWAAQDAALSALRKKLLGQDSESKQESSVKVDEAPAIPATADDGTENLADWEKELLNGNDETTPSIDPASDVWTNSDGTSFKKPATIPSGSWANYADWEKELVGEEVKPSDPLDAEPTAEDLATPTPEQPLNPSQYITPDGVKMFKPPAMSQSEWDALDGIGKESVGHFVKPTPKNNYNSTQGVEMVAPSGADIDELFTNAKIVSSNPDEHVYTKIQDAASGYGDSVWEDETGFQASSEELADGSDFKVVSFGIDEPVDVAPEVSAEPDNTSLSHQELAIEMAKFPIGTKVGDPAGLNYVKTSGDLWEENFMDEKMATEYSDSEMAELAKGIPEKYSLDKFTMPEGSSLTELEKPSENGTLGGLSKDEFKALPVGSKVVYSATGDSNNPTGTYEKTGGGLWKYTVSTEGAVPKEDIFSDNFDHLFEDGVDTSKYSLDGAEPSAEAVAPETEALTTPTGVDKHVNLGGNLVLLEGLPAGTTIKKEMHTSYYYPNDNYWVKQADGSWQEYKKTAMKTMKGNLTTSSGLTGLGKVTVSKPTSEKNAVLATGELAYEGDTVYDSGQEFTIEKINKTSIIVTDSDGNKIPKKPHALKKNVDDWAKPEANPSSAYYGPVDPVSKSAKEHAAEVQKKLAAKLAAEKLVKDLETFSGASSDDYDAQGVVMPSNPAPKTENGLTVLETGEPDKSDPLYGTTKPVAPADEANYPTFTPPAAAPLPKWDSDDWLEKVKQRYLDNPNKAKPSLEQSNKWGQVQEALAGSKSSLDALKSSMYLDDDLYNEAVQGIDAQEKANSSLKAKIVKDAKDAKDAYDAQKAIDLADLTKAKQEYQTKLEKWLKANPSTNSYKQAKKPPVSTESFEAGEADWTKAHVGTYTAQAVMDSMRDDNVLGTHGLSIATDSDQIEDLDVKVTKVLDASGVEKFEMKFKLTAPYGKAFEHSLKSDSSVNVSDTIYPSHMVKDPVTGLMKDSGKPEYAFINQGSRYTFTDPMTGAVIVFQKSSDYDGFNISSNDNTVKVHMPIDSTPEMYQQTLENMGIKKARPSTSGDIKVLAENKLLTMMGEHMGGIKSFDGRVNMGGEDRKKSLAKIKDTYGITPDDLTFSTEPNGRVRFTLDDEKASELAKKYKVSYFRHQVSGANDVDRWVNMLGGTNPGMLSTYHRYTEGIGGRGKSSPEDMSDGAGDYNYLTPQSLNNEKPNSRTGLVIKPNAIFKRMDFWANPGDGWGKKAEGSLTSNKAPYKLFDQVGNIGYSGYGSGNGIYEVLPKDTVPLSDFAYVVIGDSVRGDVIKKLQDMGILEINGLPLDQFIIPVNGTPPVDLSSPGLV